jgi:uncharacterized membrane protein (DUF4010 family)
VVTVLDTLQAIGTAAALGMLVGLQREHVGATFAGIRTFTLIAMLGCICALLGRTFGTWLVAAGLLGVAALMVAANARRTDSDPGGPGLTTEVTALLMYGLGAYLVEGETAVAVVVAGAIAVLLQLKGPMHDFVRRIGPADFTAVMRFVLITLVILPLLPDRAYGPYQVLSPRNVWLMVVLVVGIQLAGYVLYRVAGQGIGTLLGGILGGLISSTATTVSYARRAREAPDSARLAALVIMIASTVALLRVTIVAVAIAPAAVATVAWPLGTMVAAMAMITAAAFLGGQRQLVEVPPAGNPAELRPALIFAAIYALVTLGIAYAKDHSGSSGLYAVAGISGLVDMDAITLSSARLVDHGQLTASIAWRLILVAHLANLVFKGLAATALGHRRLGLHLALLFGLSLAAGIALLLCWPVSDELLASPSPAPAP